MRRPLLLALTTVGLLGVPVAAPGQPAPRVSPTTDATATTPRRRGSPIPHGLVTPPRPTRDGTAVSKIRPGEVVLPHEVKLSRIPEACRDRRLRKRFIHPSIRVGKVTIKGELLDSRARTLRVVGLEEGEPYDSCKIMLITRRLDQLGYWVKAKSVSPSGGRIRVHLTLKPITHVRHVYIQGNWPLFKDEIIRRVRYRAGSRLPHPKQEKKAFERQKERLKDFLRKEGYFNSKVEIKKENAKKPHMVNLVIKLDKGSLYYLGRLKILGNQAIATDKIRGLFFHRILWWKRAFTRSRFNKDIKSLEALYKKRGFPGISIRSNYKRRGKGNLDHRRKRVNIVLTIAEKKQVLVEFEDNERLSDKKLRGAVTFNSAGAYGEYEMRRSAAAIQRRYQTNGYYLASAAARRGEPLGRHQERIIFTVREGPQLKVASISFSGNRARSDSQLKDVIKTKVFPRLGSIGLGSGGFITDRQVKQDAARIVKHYRQRGFHNVKVKVAVALDDQGFDNASLNMVVLPTLMTKREAELHVRFTIKEGPQFVVDKLELVGKGKAWQQHHKKLRALLKVVPGTPYTRRRLFADGERIKRYLADRGYPYHRMPAYVFPSRTRRPTKGKSFVDVRYLADLGERVNIGEIFVRGNVKTSTSIILRELKFKKGDIFSLAKVERARRNLRSLGIFRGSRVEFIGVASFENPVHVIVTVTERYDDYGSIELEIGASTDNLFFGAIAYRNRNLFGWGKEIELRGEAGPEIQAGRITYKDPRFFGSRLLFDLTGFIRREQTKRLGELLTFGGRVTLLHRVSRAFQWFVRYELKRVKRSEQVIRVAAGGDERDRVDIFTNTAALGPTVVLDLRDNPLVPRRGIKLTASVRVASRYLAYPIRADDFIHLQLSAQGIIPLPAGIVIAQGLRYDHGFPLGATPVLPKTERFFAGGDTTVRGYEEDRLKTQVVFSNLSPFPRNTQTFRIKPEGGNVRIIYNLEFQFPIWRKGLFGMPILGVIFFDAGAITNSLTKDTWRDFRTSIGTALRLVSPVGFISIEYAIPFQPGLGTDPTGRAHFNFGFIF